MKQIPVAIPVLTFKKLADSIRGTAKFLGNVIYDYAIYLSLKFLMKEWTRYEQESCNMTISLWLATSLFIFISGIFLTAYTIYLLSLRSLSLVNI